MNGHWLWAFLLLYVEVVKPTYGVNMENFSTLAKLALTDTRTFMIAGGLDTLHIAAIALILIFIARIVKKKNEDQCNCSNMKCIKASSYHKRSGIRQREFR